MADNEEIDIKINSLNDKEYLKELTDKNGMAEDKLIEIVNKINEELDIFWDEVRWDEGYWDSVNEESYEHINYKIH